MKSAILDLLIISPTEIYIKPHGNSKGAEPYFRTNESTLRALKSEVKLALPKEAVERVCKEKGGEMSAKSADHYLVTGSKHTMYPSNKKPQDPLYNLILECQNLKGEDKFIREIPHLT